ncbi:MAG: hypothetical protein QGH51_09925 [Planctomycetota bacterium]|jgi:hypothetical protein|nr:hypothetical protein [Planctomycetota bacterium]MDP6942328.1 hypothetical protein [Planctomycetota bacterium]
MFTPFFLFFLAISAPSLAQEVPTSAQEPLLDRIVLKLNGEGFTARSILSENKWDESKLAEMLDRDSKQAQLFLNSPVFLARCRAFADHQALNLAKIPQVSDEVVLAESSAWAKDRSLSLAPKALMLNHGMEIQNRARILATQQSEYGTSQLRRRMLESVPEFFGELSFSWIRLPLVNLDTGLILPTEKRRDLYDLLDNTASELSNGKITWEDAVQNLATSELDKKKSGYQGLVRRDHTNRFEEPVLRVLFSDLGFKLPEGHLLRGPIAGSAWIYLLRVETVRIRGVVDLQSVREKVDRALRESKLQQDLSEIRTGVKADFLVPISE